MRTERKYLTGELEGKVAIVSGGARGQGAAEARLFIEQGAAVIIGDLLESEGSVLAESLGDRAVFVRHDVSSTQDWAHLVSVADREFGRVDVLVNNAAVFRRNTMMSTPVDEYDEVVRINQRSHFLGMRAVVPSMIAVGAGSIINVASIGATGGQTGAFSYATTKWAIRGMSKIAAIELAARGIRVNCVLPGPIDTAMFDVSLGQVGREDAMQQLSEVVPLGRFGTPHEVAEVVLFLASARSGYCTAAEFTVDGGFTGRV